MDRRILATMAVIATMAVALALTIPAAAADAEDPSDAVYYVYGETALLSYPFSDGAEITWEVTPTPGDVDIDRTYKGERVSIPLDGIDELRVVQTATLNGESDSMAITVIPMHLKYDTSDDDGRYTVRFLDGGELIQQRIFDAYTTVMGGDRFVEVPEDPTRDGCRFAGWYCVGDDGVERQYVSGSEYEPVTSDMDVYAKWTVVPEGGGSQNVVVGRYVVIFVNQAGLGETVISNDEASLSFRVDVEGGYIFAEGSVSVTAVGGSLSNDGDTYALSAITTDITVYVTGERMFTVEYHIVSSGSEVVGVYENMPTLVGGGPFSVVLPVREDSVIAVFMDGADISSTAVSGNTVAIDDVTGNLSIMVHEQDVGEQPFPWWVVAAILAAALLVMVALYRRKAREHRARLRRRAGRNAERGPQSPRSPLPRDIRIPHGFHWTA